MKEKLKEMIQQTEKDLGSARKGQLTKFGREGRARLEGRLEALREVQQGLAKAK